MPANLGLFDGKFYVDGSCDHLIRFSGMECVQQNAWSVHIQVFNPSSTKGFGITLDTKGPTPLVIS